MEDQLKAEFFQKIKDFEVNLKETKIKGIKMLEGDAISKVASGLLFGFHCNNLNKRFDEIVEIIKKNSA